MAVLYQSVPSPILVSVRLAQAILESAWGRSELAVNANNFAGIKASAPWTGERYLKLSDEEYAGKTKREPSYFRKYESVQAFVVDHSNFFTSTPERAEKVYKQAIEATTYVGQCSALTGTYATSSQYGRRLIEIIERYDLTKFDRKEDVKMTFKRPNIIDRRKEALGYPSSGYYARRHRSAIKNIVWHFTATKRTGGGFITGHERFWRDVYGWDIGGYHFYIDADGQIYWNYDLEIVTYGAGRANPYCVHISVEANSVADYSDAQKASREALTLWLLQELGLGAETVRGHKEMPGNSTTCPAYSKEELNAIRADLIVKLNGNKPQPQPKLQEQAFSAGRYQFVVNVNVRLAPRTNARKVDMYVPGETVNIEKVTQSGGFYWGQYTNYGGGQSYVALGEINGARYTKKV
ncbi:glucosaminidase domain-containing protein [Aerococcaceae bacterium NML190073]|nr:glucosaminidase domain-containing protein [Aerococcaceae bacterium NML190073]